MSKQSQVAQLSEVEQEAIAWLIKLDRDEQPDPEELASLREWLSRSPAHRQALNKANRFWSSTILTELMVPLERPHRGPLQLLVLSLLQSFKRWQLVTTGAVASLALAMVVVFNWVSSAAPDVQIYTTAVGQQEVITLADGSLAHLNTDTELQVQFTKRARVLHLIQGEVHFNVSHNASRPFQVYGGDGVVEAIGTAFTVSLLKQQMDVLVTEGLVAVSAHKVPAHNPLPSTADTSTSGSAPKDPKPDSTKSDSKGYDIRSIPSDVTLKRLATLSAGQKFSIEQAIRDDTRMKDYSRTSTAVITLSQRDIERHESWRRGLLIFSGEPLIQVIEEISRFTQVTVEIADPELRDLEIGGRFQVGDVEAMLVSLKANFNVDIERVSDNKVVIKAPR